MMIFSFVMNRRCLKALAIVVFVLMGARGEAAVRKATGRNINYFMKEVEIHHISPQPRTLQHSSVIWELYFEMIDPDRLFFTKADINRYQQYNLCDTSFLFGRFDAMFDGLIADYQANVSSYRSFVANHKDLLPNYRQNDTVTFLRPTEKRYAKDKDALEKRWNNIFKYNILALCFTDNDSLMSREISQFTLNEYRNRKIFVERELCKLNSLTADVNSMVETLSEDLYEAVANSFDPHTNYFPPAKSAMFMAALSKEELSFGLDIKLNDKHQLEVAQVQPGGPAWYSNDFKEGDIIERVQEPGKEVVDTYCGKLKEAYELIHAATCKTLHFTLKKSDGRLRTVVLVKQKMTNADNIVTGYLLQNHEAKIGYIALPSFFENYDNNPGSGCASEVAKELIKLKHDTIQALILDLRNNGGGAVDEALNLAGMFIDQGPLAVERTYRGRHQINVMSDKNKGVFYDGPLVILVNKLSASASEIFAQSIKDYNRGVIAGTPTFGKATAQTMFPLGDDTDSTNFDGLVKFTLSRYYNLKGKAHQVTGVIPDVMLHDALGSLAQKESAYKTALPKDSIAPIKGFTPLKPLPLNELNARSANRIAHSPAFDSLKVAVKALDLPSGPDSCLVLNPTAFADFVQRRMKNVTTIQKAISSVDGTIKVKLNSEDVGNGIADPVKKEMVATELKSLDKDIILEEAFHIADDLMRRE
jgi:carboxyl-terminal processing protease